MPAKPYFNWNKVFEYWLIKTRTVWVPIYALIRILKDLMAMGEKK